MITLPLTTETLELYAIGALNSEEQSHIAAALAKDPKAFQELIAIENGFERFANMQARNPSPLARAKIMTQIADSAPLAYSYEHTAAPRTPKYRLASAISAAALLITGIALWQAISFRGKWSAEQAATVALRDENDKLSAFIDSEVKRRHSDEDNLGVLRVSDVCLYKATNSSGETKGQLYWSRSRGEALFIPFEKANNLIAVIYNGGQKSEYVPIIATGLVNFYKFSLAGADSLRIENNNASDTAFGAATITLKTENSPARRRVSPKEPMLPKTGL